MVMGRREFESDIQFGWEVVLNKLEDRETGWTSIIERNVQSSLDAYY